MRFWNLIIIDPDFYIIILKYKILEFADFLCFDRLKELKFICFGAIDLSEKSSSLHPWSLCTQVCPNCITFAAYTNRTVTFIYKRYTYAHLFHPTQTQWVTWVTCSINVWQTCLGYKKFTSGAHSA
jgi:hypothetical protein